MKPHEYDGRGDEPPYPTDVDRDVERAHLRVTLRSLALYAETIRWSDEKTNTAEWLEGLAELLDEARVLVDLPRIPNRDRDEAGVTETGPGRGEG